MCEIAQNPSVVYSGSVLFNAIWMWYNFGGKNTLRIPLSGKNETRVERCTSAEYTRIFMLLYIHH
jgi:hypothetical protein